ncbi:hypothetical protein B0H14DRAFT_3907857 [Mycena olivaceomarginata]|nr:hypothetical protein B0H14DRAFT_3907857 [Mycena olivaceomarginata]
MAGQARFNAPSPVYKLPRGRKNANTVPGPREPICRIFFCFPLQSFILCFQLENLYSSDSDDDPELSHTKTLSDNHSSLGRSTSITLLGDMDNDSSGEFEGEEPDESSDMAQDDEDEGSDDERQTKHTADPPKEITINISLYSQKEMRKPLKKREPTACGLMQMPSDTLYYRFERKLLSKLATLAKVAVVSEEEDVQIEFQLPRHVSNYVQLDDEAAYKVMVVAGIKCKDPKINLAVVRLQENGGKDSDAEDDKKKKKKKKDPKKSKIPSENDISAPNAEINAKIGLLRTKYTCHANDGSDYCWVSGEEKRHIPLGHVHFNLWAAAWAKGDADANTPPNHAIFSGKGNGGLAPSSILQKRIAANAANQPTSTAPTINISFDGLANFFRPAPAPAAGQLHHVKEPNMLIPPNTQPGEPMSISMFCIQYNLDDCILEKLTANQYKNASAFRFIRLMDLEKMDFLPGDIAELQDAVRQWAVPL